MADELDESPPEDPREPAEEKPAASGRKDWHVIEIANLIMNVIMTVQSFRAR